MTTFLDRPVSGDKTRGASPQAQQWDEARFRLLIDAGLALPGVVAIRWTQYTPYFNDGDPCEFGIGEPYVGFATAQNGVDRDDEDEDDEAQTFWYPNYQLTDYVDRKLVPKAGYEPHTDWLDRWGEEVEHFENVLLDAFGDHAEVVARSDSFAIESYDHE